MTKKIKIKSRSPVDTETRCAFHEAGHAVARVVLDLPFANVSLETSTERVTLTTGEEADLHFTIGVTEADGLRNRHRAERKEGLLDIRLLVTSMAGPVAEMMLVGVLDDGVRLGFQGDCLHTVVVLAGALGVPPTAAAVDATPLGKAVFDGAREQALRLLVPHFASVGAVAGALVARRSLTFADVEALVRENGGPANELASQAFLGGARSSDDGNNSPSSEKRRSRH